MNRYSRQITLDQIGLEGQKKLQTSSICIVGIGGLGVPVSIYLAGAGIGKICLVDFDSVEIHNLHRQPIYKEKDVSLKKVNVMAEHLTGLNGEIDVIPKCLLLSDENALTVFKDFDIIVDCSDNLETRYLINDACIILNKPFVSSSIFKYEGQVGVFNFKNGPSYRCLYPKPSDVTQIASCEATGVLGTLPAIMGSIQANEVLKMILGWENILSGKVLFTNVLNYYTSLFHVERNEKNFSDVIEHGLSTNFSTEEEKYLSISWMKLKDIIHQNQVEFVDVREKIEIPRINSPLIHRMPLSEGMETGKKIAVSSTVITFCQSGIRSLKAAREFKEMGYKNVYSLEEGIEPILSSGMFRPQSE